MQSIIPPVDRDLILSELTEDKFLGNTHRANNKLYVFTAHDAPNLMQEVGRLREISFRYHGGGTGQPTDIDEFDTMEVPYKQLIVWDPEREEILGGYRFICGSDVKYDIKGNPILATTHLFHFSETFKNNYLPNTIELGRSFVALEHQSTLENRKSIYTLDNLWDGLGAFPTVDPRIKYFFGKVTMYGSYNKTARNLILALMNCYFPDNEKLVYPINSIESGIDLEKYSANFSKKNFSDDYKKLNSMVRSLGLNIPPLVNAYMGLSPKLRVFGTALNRSFGNVEEIGILIPIDELFESKKVRYINKFINGKEPGFFERLRKRLKW